jgi:hypothetical protein
MYFRLFFFDFFCDGRKSRKKHDKNSISSSALDLVPGMDHHDDSLSSHKPRHDTILYRDLVQHCFGFLGLSDLARCTRVSRTWNAWVATMPCTQRELNHNWSKMRTFTYAPSSSLLKHITAICVRGIRWSMTADALVPFSHLHTLSVTNARMQTIDAIQRVPSIRTLDVILCMPVEQVRYIQFRSWVQCFPRLHTLRLDFSKEQTFSDSQIDDLCAIPTLRHVSLPVFQYYMEPDMRSQNLARIGRHSVPWETFNLQNMSLTPDDMRHLSNLRHLTRLEPSTFQVDASTPPLPGLVHLDISFVQSDLDALRVWVDRHPQLTSLRVQIPKTHTALALVEHILETHPSLDTLYVHLSENPYVSENIDHHAVLIACLARSPHVRHVTLTCLNMAHLHALVSCTKLATLHAFYFVVQSNDERRQLREYAAHPTTLAPTLSGFVW